MNRTVKITESQLNNIVRKIISEDAIIHYHYRQILTQKMLIPHLGKESRVEIYQLQLVRQDQTYLS
jgi:hypothetical protein